MRRSAPATPGSGCLPFREVARRAVLFSLVVLWACSADQEVEEEDPFAEVAPPQDPPWGQQARPAGPAHFRDVARAAGLTHVQYAWPASPEECLMESTYYPYAECEMESFSGGVTVGDCDGDGWDDLYFTVLLGRDRLYRNLGDGTFVDVSEAAGVALDGTASQGAAFADVDLDGDLDLFVSGLGSARHWLWINAGACRFQEQGIERGAALVLPTGFHRATTPAFGDLNGDSFPDLVVAEWNPGGNASITRRPVHESAVFLNRGAVAPGFFEQTRLDGVDFTNRATHSVALVDLDRNGHVDIVTAGDFQDSVVFWNEGGGRFTDGTAAHPVSSVIDAMGSAIGDVDRDGVLDWFVSEVTCPGCSVYTQPGHGNALFRGLGGRDFEVVTDAFGVRDGFYGWGAAFLDFDNDGDLDLSMVNGFRFIPPGSQVELLGADPNRLWVNDGQGHMTEEAEARGIADRRQGRGWVALDYDRDGDVDLAGANSADTPMLFQNDGGNAADWLRVRVVGPPAARGEGAWVALAGGPESAPQVRLVGAGTHFLGQSEAVAHFGLGAPSSTLAPGVQITWPRGAVTEIPPGPRNREITVTPPDAERMVPSGWLTLAVLGEGTTVPAPGRYPLFPGSRLPIQALPAGPGRHVFAGWEGPVTERSALQTEVVDSDGDVELVAVFSVAAGAEVDVTADAGGEVWPSAGPWRLSRDQSAELVAVPDAGFEFAGWRMGGVSDLILTPTLRVDVRSPSVRATFVARPPFVYGVDRSR